MQMQAEDKVDTAWRLGFSCGDMSTLTFSFPFLFIHITRDIFDSQ